MFATFASFGTEKSFNAVLEPIVRYLYSLVVPEHLVRPLTVLSLVSLTHRCLDLAARRYAREQNLRDPRLRPPSPPSCCSAYQPCIFGICCWRCHLRHLSVHGAFYALAGFDPCLLAARHRHSSQRRSMDGRQHGAQSHASTAALALIWESLGKPGLPPPNPISRKLTQRLANVEHAS